MLNEKPGPTASFSYFSSSNTTNYYTIRAIELRESPGSGLKSKRSRGSAKSSGVKAHRRAKQGLAEAARCFEEAECADDVINLALELEEKWTQDPSHSSKHIAEMLALAKLDIFDRLKEQRSNPSQIIADFMNKKRTSYSFFGLSFQLTLFSTPSKKRYDLFVRTQPQEIEEEQLESKNSSSRCYAARGHKFKLS